jgi:hypothetical protein
MIKRLSPLVSILLFAACQQGPAVKKAAPSDSRLAPIKEVISKVTPEGKRIIERAKQARPEIDQHISAKTLAEIIEEYSTRRGDYNITEIGWEASQKKNGRWKVVFYYEDYKHEISSAEWEYDADTGRLVAFDMRNSRQFWLGDEQTRSSRSR